MRLNGVICIILNGCMSIIRSGPSLTPTGAAKATLTSTTGGTHVIGGSETTATGSKSITQIGQIDIRTGVVLVNSRSVFCGHAARRVQYGRFFVLRKRLWVRKQMSCQEQQQDPYADNREPHAYTERPTKPMTFDLHP